MKRKLLLGMAFVVTALLLFSCNKNRFDFDHVEQVEGSGQWKLPIGSANVSLKQVLDQFQYNGLIQHDPQSNLFVGYDFTMDNILMGSSFLTLNSYEFEADLELPNDLYDQGLIIPGVFDTILHFHQMIPIETDSVSSIVSVKIQTGTIGLIPTSNMFNIKSWRISSPDVTNPQWPGDTLNDDAEHVDLTGAYFNLTNDSIVLNYLIHCEFDSTILQQPNFQLKANVYLRDLKIEQLSGHLTTEIIPIQFDTTFSLPSNNLEGSLQLVGTQLDIRHKNTFGNLTANLTMDTLEFYGGNMTPSPIFPEGFTPLDLDPTGNEFVTTTYHPNFSINAEHKGFRLGGATIFNPGGESNLITVYNTSTIGVGLGVKVPFSFSQSDVTYLDTFDIDISKIEVTDFINEVILHIDFDSQFPFNLSAQLYMLDENEQVTGELLDNELAIGAWHPGSPAVRTSTSVSVTQERLRNFFDCKKLKLRANLNTGSTTASINLNNSLGVTLKADVIYGGSVDLNN